MEEFSAFFLAVIFIFTVFSLLFGVCYYIYRLYKFIVLIRQNGLQWFIYLFKRNAITYLKDLKTFMIVFSSIILVILIIFITAYFISYLIIN